MLRIEVDDRGNGLVVKAAGELSLIEIPNFEQTFKRYQESNLQVVALDLSEMPFLDSFGISRIIKLSRKFTESGTDFVLIELNEKIQQSFRIGTLDRFFPIMSMTEFDDKYFSEGASV